MNKVNQIITDRIIAELQKGQIPWKKPWTATDFPKNYVSGHEYSGINVFLLSMSGFTSPYWLSFKQISDNGGRVKKGEKSTPVIFWKPTDYTYKVDDNDDEEEEKIRHGLILRYYNVFNYEQTEGLKPKEAIKNEFNPIEEAEKLIKLYKDKPEIKFGGNRAFFSPSQDIIQLPLKNSFTSPQEFYSTLFHEFTHSTGSDKRLKRFAIENYSHAFGSEDYSKEELIAEMGSAFLCSRAGIIQPVLSNQTAYIQSWLRALKNDEKLVVSAGAKAQRAVNYILGIKREEKTAQTTEQAVIQA